MKTTAHTHGRQTGFLDDNGNHLVEGDTIEMIFNKGTFKQAKGKFDIVWNRGAFMLKSHVTGRLSYMGGVSEFVSVLRVD